MGYSRTRHAALHQIIIDQALFPEYIIPGKNLEFAIKIRARVNSYRYIFHYSYSTKITRLCSVIFLVLERWIIGEINGFFFSGTCSTSNPRKNITKSFKKKSFYGIQTKICPCFFDCMFIEYTFLTLNQLFDAPKMIHVNQNVLVEFDHLINKWRVLLNSWSKVSRRSYNSIN